ncbi:glycoside hydrolase family 108 protein [Carnimonas bestiolae]|uniref:glycoside hydrolase family 108 protein n=1 Tax=Carnimonas bestiolae TaxID=3402172 RepID=UPI003EDBA1A8
MKHVKKTAAVAAAIIASVVGVEGGYVDDPSDPGGKTNHGITEKVARQHGYQGNMRDLTVSQADKIYYQDYIEKPGFGPFLDIQPAVAHKLIDAGVNTGPANASRWLQRSLNALNRGGKDYANISVDGKVGPATIGAYQSLAKRRGDVKACEMTIKLLDAQQAGYYASLNTSDTYLPGWTDNRVGNVPLEWCSHYPVAQ